MKKQNGESGNMSLLQQFAVKSEKKKVVYNDKAVIYNRCSTEKQDSLEWQEKVCENHCRQNNFNLIRRFGEKESATTDDRKEFKAMIEFCQKENISNIVIYSYDRFSRTGELELLKTLRSNGIRIHAATQGVDDQTPGGRMAQQMYLMFAEMENEDRRAKIIEGQKNKLRKGEWVGKPTIGYLKEYVTGKKEHDHDKKQCFISEEGKLIKQAFLWKDQENLTYEKIIERLGTMGLHLTSAQLTRIFRNPFYCGYITSSALEDGEIIRGKHEPLISEDLFLRVNGIVSGNQHGWKVYRQNEEMPLKTSVKCGKCNRPLTAYPQKGKYIYYKCPNNGCCINISNKKLHQLFAAELSKFAIQPQLFPVIKNQLEATYNMLHSSELAREKPMKDELTRLKNELDTMELNLVTNKISIELFQKYSPAHNQRIKDIEDQLGILSKNSSNLEIHLDTALKSTNNLLNLWELLDFNGKIKLQKLVYPEGLSYLPENHALRTNSVNPIFSAITSISANLMAKAGQEQGQDDLKLRQLYLMFGSSNFYWENLEKIALFCKDLEKTNLTMDLSVQKQVISMTGTTLSGACFQESNMTGIAETYPKTSYLYSNTGNTYSGVTNGSGITSVKGPEENGFRLGKRP